jgi:hypothetical protein
MCGWTTSLFKWMQSVLFGKHYFPSNKYDPRSCGMSHEPTLVGAPCFFQPVSLPLSWSSPTCIMQLLCSAFLCYNQYVLKLNVFLSLTGNCGKSNLKTFMWLIKETSRIFISFSEVRRGLHMNMYYIFVNMVFFHTCLDELQVFYSG